jgi:hypothetical protein
MKKQSRNIITTLSLVLLTPLVCAQQTLQPPAIPQPLIAQREAGQYLPQLEKLQTLLKEKKHLEFYVESEKTFERAYEDDGRKLKFLKGNKPTKEKLAALEWVYYYRLITPLLSSEQLEENGKMHYNEDYSSKIDACERLCQERTSEVAELFSIDENELLKHRIEIIAETMAFLNKLSIYSKDTKTRTEEDATQLEKFEGNAMRNNRGFSSMNESFINPSPEYMEVRRKKSSRQERRSSMKRQIERMLNSNMDYYIRKLAAYFPKQGKTVQEYIKKTGFHVNDVQEVLEKVGIDYPSELHLAILLRRAIERNKETEWLFKGLPSNEKIDAMVQKIIRESRERAARLVEESKRLEKKKAEELAKKQAEEARREAARRAAAQVNPATPPSPQ